MTQKIAISPEMKVKGWILDDISPVNTHESGRMARIHTTALTDIDLQFIVMVNPGGEDNEEQWEPRGQWHDLDYALNVAHRYLEKGTS